MGIGAGINFTVSGVLQALSNLSATVVGTAENTIASLLGPWRPPQWAKPPQTTITVPGDPGQSYSSASLGISAGGPALATNDAGQRLDILAQTGTALVPGATSSPSIVYVFDGVLKIEHSTEIELTRHPIQNGANISDHAYIKAARVSMDILMSDAMQSYTIGQWQGGTTKSVNCFQTMQALQAARKLVTLTCRLQTYKNMALIAIHAPDDNKTQHGLRATLTFEQVFVASVDLDDPNWSARPNDTSVFTGGLIPTTDVPASVGSSYYVSPPAVTAPQVTGAGNWSSNPDVEYNLSSLGS